MKPLGVVLAFTIVVGEIRGASAQSVEAMPPRQPSPLSVRQLHSGHSLTDTYVNAPWPGRLVLATAVFAGREAAYRTVINDTIPGSSLGWRWNHASNTPNAREHIDRFELLVTTERVPLSLDRATLKADTLDWLDRWVAHAAQKGNAGKGAEVLLYSTWTNWRIPDGQSHNRKHPISFRQDLENQEKSWELMQDTANTNRPSGMPLIYMIPGHRLMMRIYDDIKSGTAPGLANIGDVFNDDIHLNNLGQYAITCLVYAVIYHRNPSELPTRLAVPEDKLTREQADYFKAAAWNVAKSYPRSGVPPR